MAFLPYPQEIPSADIVTLVVDALMRKAVNWPEAAHAAWHVVGFGLSQWDVHMPTAQEVPAVTAQADKGMSDGEAATVLREAFCTHATQASIIDKETWDLLIPVLLRLIERIIFGS